MIAHFQNDSKVFAYHGGHGVSRSSTVLPSHRHAVVPFIKPTPDPAGWPCEIWLMPSASRYFTGLAPSPPTGGSALSEEGIQEDHPLGLA
jgi:hypothetical protein